MAPDCHPVCIVETRFVLPNKDSLRTNVVQADPCEIRSSFEGEIGGRVVWLSAGKAADQIVIFSVFDGGQVGT